MALHPGDRIISATNDYLWWLVVGADEGRIFILHASPEHRGTHYGKCSSVVATADFGSGFLYVTKKETE